MGETLKLYLFIAGLSTFFTVAYAMDCKELTQQKKMVLYEATRQNKISVLLVSDYIVKGMNSWRMFKTEEFLLNLCIWQLHKQRINSEKNNECSMLVERSSFYPQKLCNKQQQQKQHDDYSDIYIEMQGRQPEHTIFSEQDLDHTERLSNGGYVCCGNVVCGTIMLGIILTLTFCR
jgi:hypothetical protein